MSMFYVLSACSDLPCPVFKIAHIVKQIIEIVVPIILILYGMIDFAKATMAHDEGDIAKAKEKFIRRLIAGASVFFVMAILEFAFNIIASSAQGVEDGKDGASVWTCVSQIFNGDTSACDCNPYETGTQLPGSGECDE